MNEVLYYELRGFSPWYHRVYLALCDGILDVIEREMMLIREYKGKIHFRLKSHLISKECHEYLKRAAGGGQPL